MSRRPFDIVAAFSLLVCGIELVLWGMPALVFEIRFGTGMSLIDRLFIPITGIAPIIWFVTTTKHPRRRIIPSGICMKCGYDLRATPDRCPECGTIPPKEEIISN
jgi:hypothetical protein